jgi:hypothetical protein
MPVAAHLLYPQFMPESEPGQRELGLNFAVRLLGMCDQLWVFGENISAGMLREIAAATECGMEIHYYNESGELLK